MNILRVVHQDYEMIGKNYVGNIWRKKWCIYIAVGESDTTIRVRDFDVPFKLMWFKDKKELRACLNYYNYKLEDFIK